MDSKQSKPTLVKSGASNERPHRVRDGNIGLRGVPPVMPPSVAAPEPPKGNERPHSDLDADLYRLGWEAGFALAKDARESVKEAEAENARLVAEVFELRMTAERLQRRYRNLAESSLVVASFGYAVAVIGWAAYFIARGGA